MKKPEKEEKPLSGAQEAYEWLQILIVALVTIILVFTFVGRITPVVGESMLPTLHEGDVMLIRDIGYTDPQPGDIVVFGDRVHIGLCSDRRNRQGIPFLIHHGNPIDEAVERNDIPRMTVTGHFRWLG